ncbi:cryptochrome/photolyase family protein [Hufsiella ginkgonis]|uniref:Deoxyribodipyrimidine photo-lyase n=1 Tax=Hufsiella ginkgonis TaxID=2695274 RepID=A0A7K1Y2N5_9SPHI|nr:deoxyribodipyrimidine photo-lyase [Hufsiella ginkgonis]MXV16946.1 deoxyribodipyrimidine photo-lyase [Hufsiella ginkgonis]
MANKRSPVNIFWFRRDLRLTDNAGLYHALKQGLPVIPLFIFDTHILDKLPDKNDARVTFIHHALAEMNEELTRFSSSLCVKYGKPEEVWQELTAEFDIREVIANTDYEPYATEREDKVRKVLGKNKIPLTTYKDQVIFEKDEVVKDDGKPYTVFTPYKRKWLATLNPELHLKAYPVTKYAKNFYAHTSWELPSLKQIGFEKSDLELPGKTYRDVIEDYHRTRDFPSVEGTSRIGAHLRFGTLSIRKVTLDAWEAREKTWLNELVWRDFYAMILWHFPETATAAFRKNFDNIRWRNHEAEFEAWCEGKTGYPLVDAGMRQLNETGWMHNRIRMVTASFLAKHLLIDWRWGEAYFARRLIDYDMASNVGGWQWAAGSGNDAVPYFRVFNPQLQQERFDPEMKYIRRWVPEFHDPFKYPKPIVDHREARERVLKEFKRAFAG